MYLQISVKDLFHLAPSLLHTRIDMLSFTPIPGVKGRVQSWVHFFPVGAGLGSKNGTQRLAFGSYGSPTRTASILTALHRM